MVLNQVHPARHGRRGSGRRVLQAFVALGIVAGAGISAPASAYALPSNAVAQQLGAANDAELTGFYRTRQNRPLWVASGRLLPDALRAVEMIASAGDHGLEPAAYDIAALQRAVGAADRGDAAALARAEVALSRAVGAYLSDLRNPAGVDMVYVDRELAPARMTVRSALQQLAAAPSIAGGLAAATRMNPLYERLRAGFAEQRSRGGLSTAQERQFRANLDRARALPVDLGERYVLVDAASARLWMMEGGRVAGTMRVVVGRETDPTPMMAGYIRHLTLNPYWNVPPDLVQERIAPRVMAEGDRYLRNAGYEVLSGWGPDARPLTAAAVDWQAVSSGQRELPVRQRPGPTNAMGSVKFMFPNDRGIYLHDTPSRDLFRASDRRQSAGCVRVEDAATLARWLHGGSVRPNGDAPEQQVDLRTPVPVYITYLTAIPEGGRIAFHPDAYGRDGRALRGAGAFASVR